MIKKGLQYFQTPIMDNQEGFAEEALFQLVDFNYKPSSRAWTTEGKSCGPISKKVNPLILLNSSKLINSSIQSEWKLSLDIGGKNNVVYNAGARTEVDFTEQNIKFMSAMESGNMEIATRKKNNEYQLYMKPDSNTKAHFQWFYFKVYIIKGKKTVRFLIKNFIKATMLYSKGLKPFCRSLNNPDFHEFRQLDTPVTFSEDRESDFYQLEFSYGFDFDRDEVQFCSQPPYTFQNLQQHIRTLSCKKLTLGKTVLGTKIPYLVFEALKETKVVAIAIARQHPGEAVGSWMMEGLINQLSERKGLDYITWVVVPMVNIDGVILGNNRTGVLGHDFNRNWAADQMSLTKNSKLFPEIFSIVTLVKSLKRKYQRKVKLFIDLHGHSSQPNVFTYGPPHEEQSEYFFQCRLFPELMAKRNPDFKLDQCSYVLHPEKKHTARSVIFFNLGVPYTYTIESTFGIMNGRTVTTDDFIRIGYDVGVCASDFLHTVVIKDSSHPSGSILEEIKIKYADAKNEGIEYDSASEASDEHPCRKKIEEMVLQEGEDSGRKNDRYEEKSPTMEHKQRSVTKPTYSEGSDREGRANCSVQKSRKKRVNTEGQLVIKRKECIFPKIGTKNGKLSFDEGHFFTSEEMMQNLKVEDIQKRLHRLRNSKLGKKILIINAYSS